MDAQQHVSANYTSVFKALEALREIPARDEASERRGRERFLQEVRALSQAPSGAT